MTHVARKLSSNTSHFPESEIVSGAQWLAPLGCTQGLERAAVDTLQRNPASFANSDLQAIARYEAWTPKFTAKNAKQAVLAFNGDVYEGLDAKTLSAQDLDWAQNHVGILSGLYGVLRPLDWMQPYRLEMGTTLQTDKGSNLYKFWGPQIADHLNAQLAKDKTPVIVNLASQEYFKSVDRKTLKARVIECVFEDFKGGKYKIISFNAKRARGLMARFAIQNKITHPEGLLGFDLEGYAYDPQVSEPDRLVFRRKVQA
jgi:cytoplasmic iron level regulating protein YaaA (DUF328/UPF0246 family)